MEEGKKKKELNSLVKFSKTTWRQSRHVSPPGLLAVLVTGKKKLAHRQVKYTIKMCSVAAMWT